MPVSCSPRPADRHQPSPLPCPGRAWQFQPLGFPPVCWEPGHRCESMGCSLLPWEELGDRNRGVLNSSKGLCQGKPPRCGTWTREGGLVIKHNICPAADKGQCLLLRGLRLKVLSVGMCWGISAEQAAPSALHICSGHLSLSALERAPGDERAALGTAQPLRKWLCGKCRHRGAVPHLADGDNGNYSLQSYSAAEYSKILKVWSKRNKLSPQKRWVCL